MKQLLLFLSFFTLESAFSQDIEKIEIPKGVVYNYSDNQIIAKAKKLITDNLSQNTDYSILQDHMIIGPELWKRYGKIERLQQIVGNVDFQVDDVVLKGKMSQDMADSKLIWNEFRKEITGEYKIRKANKLELQYYWSVISFDIDEPLLILETKNHNYILNLLKKDMKLLWLDEAPRSTEYFNPIENQTYTSEGGFKAYRNGEQVTSISKGEKETKLEKVILLSSEQELTANSSMAELQAIIEKTTKIFEDLFKTSDKSGKIMIQFELKKNKNEIQFAVRDDIDLTVMKKFEARVNNTKYPKSKKDPVKIQLVFKVNSFDDH
jgi:hypothetical protein